MRRARIKADKESPNAVYHCVSRVVDRRFVLDAIEKERLVTILRNYEDFCGVRLLTFCVMSNHFHVLVNVPRRPGEGELPCDAELVRRIHTSLTRM